MENHCLTKTSEFRLFNTSYFEESFGSIIIISLLDFLFQPSRGAQVFQQLRPHPTGLIVTHSAYSENHCLGVSCAAGLRPHPALTVLQPLVHAVGEGILDG